jgi:hypothetical protein
MVSTALFQAGVVVRNGEMESQLQASAQSFSVPFWSDLSDAEADITSDDPASTALRRRSSQRRKSFVVVFALKLVGNGPGLGAERQRCSCSHTYSTDCDEECMSHYGNSARERIVSVTTSDRELRLKMLN